MNSTSVSTPERRHSLAKKKTVRIPDMTELHHTQFPAIPCWTTKPVTASGVSAAKVVATIEMPASHHGTLRPERKNSPRLAPPRRAKAIPMPRFTAKKPAITAMSTAERRMRPASHEAARALSGRALTGLQRKDIRGRGKGLGSALDGYSVASTGNGEVSERGRRRRGTGAPS